jgi:hypothetical protein
MRNEKGKNSAPWKIPLSFGDALLPIPHLAFRIPYLTGLFLDKGKRGSLCFVRTFQGPLGWRKEDFPFQSRMGE